MVPLLAIIIIIYKYLGVEAHIPGNFNICMKQDRSSLAHQYCGILDSLSFVQLIDQFTRITANSSSVLDHILTNSETKVVKSGVMDLSLSDHRAVYFIRGAPVNGRGGISKIQSQRVMGGYSKERLHDELRNVDWSSVFLATDVNLALERFRLIFFAIIDKVAPYREYRPKLNSAPWMCGEIIAGIKRRNNLFSRFKKDRSNESLYREYCSQRNEVQRDIKLAKSDYFRRRLDESGNDSGKLWKQLGSFGKKSGAGGSIVLESFRCQMYHGFSMNSIPRSLLNW